MKGNRGRKGVFKECLKSEAERYTSDSRQFIPKFKITETMREKLVWERKGEKVMSGFGR